MLQEKIIRKNPLFELYVEENHLIVNNTDYSKDNCFINLNTISRLELIRNLSVLEKIIEVTFGFWKQSKTDILRINIKKSFKDILLTDCDIKKIELIIYKINRLILEQENKPKLS